MKIRRLLKWILVVLVVLAVVIRVAIPIAGTVAANRVLPEVLGTDAQIGNISMVLVRGKLSVGDIKVGQPQGFEGAPLLTLKRIGVDIDLSSLRKGPLTIEDVTVTDLNLNLICDSNGVINATALAQSSDTNAPEPSAETSAPPAVVVEKFNVSNLSVKYTDYSCDPVMVIDITNLNITATNIVFDPAAAGGTNLLTALTLTAVMKQAGVTNDAYLGVTARTGVLGTGIPAVNLLARLSGFDLKTVKALLVPGITQTLGGSCIDAYVDLVLASDVLDCKAVVKSKGASLPFAVGGTPEHPEVDKSTALGNLVTRPGAVVGSLVKDTAGAGVALAKGAGSTVAAAGSGAARTVAGLGKGLFHTAKSVATLDIKGAGKGLSEATVGTVKNAAGMVGDTAGAAVQGVAETGSTLSGQARGDNWRTASRERWETQWDEALREIKKMPYPQPRK